MMPPRTEAFPTAQGRPIKLVVLVAGIWTLGETRPAEKWSYADCEGDLFCVFALIYPTVTTLMIIDIKCCHKT
jgi:hypothetical protein